MSLGVDRRLEMERIQALRGLGLRDADASPDLQDLCRDVQARFGVDVVLMTLVDTDRQIILARVGTDLESMPRSDAFCDHLIRSNTLLVVPDARLDPRFASNPLVTGEWQVRFYAGAPLIFRGEVRLGGLCLLDRQPRTLTGRDLSDLAELADEAMIRILEQQLDLGRPRRGPL